MTTKTAAKSKRSLLTQGARSRPDGRNSPQMHRQDQRISPNDLKKHLCVREELSARGPAAESYRGAVHSFIKWAESHDLALVDNDAIDHAPCSSVTTCFLEGKMSSAADHLIAGLMFLDPRFSRTGTEGSGAFGRVEFTQHPDSHEHCERSEPSDLHKESQGPCAETTERQSHSHVVAQENRRWVFVDAAAPHALPIA